MESEIKLSVIVPVYNVEKYVERCVRSLMEQTLKEGVEFIFIDDASPDNSMTILRDVVARYPDRKEQVRIIHHPKNLGIYEVRKRGIEEAKGEYIGWCDSDDWCELNMFEYMLNKAYDGNYDIVVCDTFMHEINKNGKEKVGLWKFLRAETPEYAFANIKNCIPNALWMQISKKHQIKKAIQKVYPVSFCEDTFINFFIFLNAETAYWTEKSLYHYDRTRENTLSKSIRQTKGEWQATKKNIDKVLFELKRKDNFSDYRRSIYREILYMKKNYRESFDSLWDYWSAYKGVYKYDNTPKNKRWKVWLTYNFFPLYLLKFRNEKGTF